MIEYTPEEKKIINELYKNLYDEAEILHTVSKSFRQELHEGDIEAEKLLNTAVFHATNSFRDIGEELDSYGGFDMMKQAIYTISKVGFSIAVIESAWDGIGNWKV